MSSAVTYAPSCQKSSNAVSSYKEKEKKEFLSNIFLEITDKPYSGCTEEEQLARRYTLIYIVKMINNIGESELKKILTNNTIFKELKIKRSTAYRILHEEEKNHSYGLLLHNKAPKKDTVSKLSRDKKEEIKSCIENSTPSEHNINSALWTRKAVQQLISDKYQISLSKKSISRWLKRENFVFRRPAKYNIKRDQEKIDEFRNIAFKILQKKYEGHLMFFMDETHAQQDSSHEIGFSPRGKAPVIRHNLSVSGHRVETVFIAMANTGQMVYSIETEGTSNADDVIFFFKEIQKKFKNQKIVIILDNARIHHSKKVRNFLKRKRNLKIEFLPPYAPDINPVELLNQAFKKVLRLQNPMTKEQIIDFSYRFFENIKGDLEYIKRFFTSKEVRYARAGENPAA